MTILLREKVDFANCLHTGISDKPPARILVARAEDRASSAALDPA